VVSCGIWQTGTQNLEKKLAAKISSGPCFRWLLILVMWRSLLFVIELCTWDIFCCWCRVV